MYQEFRSKKKQKKQSAVNIMMTHAGFSFIDHDYLEKSSFVLNRWQTITQVPWCMSGSLNRGGGGNVPEFPAHAQPAILRLW